jgi:hypothetical protein
MTVAAGQYPVATQTAPTRYARGLDDARWESDVVTDHNPSSPDDHEPSPQAQAMTARLWRQLGPPMPVYTVYAFFDHDDRLLYVGVTGQREQRSHQHSATSTTWWYLVARAAFEHFHGPTAKDDALARERELIQELCPHFNMVGNPRPRSQGVRIFSGPGGWVVDTPDAEGTEAYDALIQALRP